MECGPEDSLGGNGGDLGVKGGDESEVTARVETVVVVVVVIVVIVVVYMTWIMFSDVLEVGEP